MTSTTLIVENYLTTDYMNYVVFFNIFFGRSCYPVKRKNTSIRACLLKGWSFLKKLSDYKNPALRTVEEVYCILVTRFGCFVWQTDERVWTSTYSRQWMREWSYTTTQNSLHQGNDTDLSPCRSFSDARVCVEQLVPPNGQTSKICQNKIQNT